MSCGPNTHPGNFIFQFFQALQLCTQINAPIHGKSQYYLHRRQT